MIEFTGFEEKHRDGVISLMMRNYESLGELSPDAVGRWIDPLLSYRWGSDQPVNLPYQHGMVMLADGVVTGFVGCVYSYVEEEDRRLSVCKTTTVAVDKEYRRFDPGTGVKERAIEAMYRMILDSADIVTGDTPIDKMRVFLRDVMHFSDYDTKNYKFLTIPCFGRKLRYTFAEKPEDIADEGIRAVYKDHAGYSLRCVRASGEEGDCCVFYRIIKKKFRKKPFDKLKITFASVLEVTDHDMFGKYAHEIIWAIQKRERAFLEADSRYFGSAGPSYPFKYKTYETYRMCFSGAEGIDTRKLGGLYSELIMLGDPGENR